MEQMNHLSLFSGYEGFGLGLRLAGLDIKTVGYCEYDKYCQEIIRARVRDGFLDDAPIWPDVRTFPGHLYHGKVDIITGGFPCQPHATVGPYRGESDERNLWPDTLRLVDAIRPGCVLLENVPGILSNGYIGTVVGGLSSIGYDSFWKTISAGESGANHLRRRVFILAYPTGQLVPQWLFGGDSQESNERNTSPKIRGPYRSESQMGCQIITRVRIRQWWLSEPSSTRMVHGTPTELEQIHALGNGIVPAVVAEFLRRLQI